MMACPDNRMQPNVGVYGQLLFEAPALCWPAFNRKPLPSQAPKPLANLNSQTAVPLRAHLPSAVQHLPIEAGDGVLGLLGAGEPGQKGLNETAPSHKLPKSGSCWPVAAGSY